MHVSLQLIPIITLRDIAKFYFSMVKDFVSCYHCQQQKKKNRYSPEKMKRFSFQSEFNLHIKVSPTRISTAVKNHLQLLTLIS